MSTQGRAPQQEPKSWYAANMGNDSQGLIVDEKTGANIAVAYDRKHAPLLAAAPAMYEALQEARDYIRQLVDSKEDEAIDNLTNNGEDVEERLNQILAQAEGR